MPDAVMDESLTDYFDRPANEMPEIIDLRDLEAPGPMENVLLACAQLQPGQVYLAHLPHVPIMLFPHLGSRGLRWQVREQPDQSALLAVFRD